MTGIGKSGPAPRRYTRNTPAVALAIATGTRLRGLHSNSSSSTASRIAATGVANVADMPAAAPATRSVVRSASVSVNPLRDERAQSSARHDDRAFRAERAAGANRDRRRYRLENRDLRIDPRAVQQNRLDGLRNPVPADFVGAKTSHQANQKSANHRNNDHPVAQRASCRRYADRTEPVIVEKIRRDRDQPKQKRPQERSRRRR